MPSKAEDIVTKNDEYGEPHLNMRRLVILIALLPFALMAAPPKFESYRVTLHPIKKFARTQIPKEGLNWKMEDYLRYSDKEPLDFADRFTLFDIGCGTGCVEYCLIDRTTGVVYPGTDFTQDFPRDYRGPFGLQFRRNSRLLVVYHAVGFEHPVHISYYVLDGTKMKLLQSDEIQASKSNKSAAELTTPSYKVTVEVRCPEGDVTCDDVRYVGVNRKSGKSITLTGRTVHTTGADGVTPSRLLGYEFKSGKTTYFVYEDGELRVTRGSKVLVQETGVWKW